MRITRLTAIVAWAATLLAATGCALLLLGSSVTRAAPAMGPPGVATLPCAQHDAVPPAAPAVPAVAAAAAVRAAATR